MNKPILAQALEAPTLDAALKLIMDALGITAGDVASHSFSPLEEKFWQTQPRRHRAIVLSRWLSNELNLSD